MLPASIILTSHMSGLIKAYINQQPTKPQSKLVAGCGENRMLYRQAYTIFVWSVQKVDKKTCSLRQVKRLSYMHKYSYHNGNSHILDIRTSKKVIFCQLYLFFFLKLLLWKQLCCCNVLASWVIQFKGTN